jgi:hypothetical protein
MKISSYHPSAFPRSFGGKTSEMEAAPKLIKGEPNAAQHPRKNNWEMIFMLWRFNVNVVNQFVVEREKKKRKKIK